MRIEEYHRGDVFFADLGSLDLGELYYHRQAGARPVVIVQNDVGCFFSETLTIVPLTSQLKRPDLESHYTWRWRRQSTPLTSVRSVFILEGYPMTIWPALTRQSPVI